MLRVWLFMILFLSTLSACAPTTAVVPIAKTGLTKPPGCVIDIYEAFQPIKRPVKDIGHISVGDSGFTAICGRQTMIDLARDQACASGADALHLVSVKPPDFFSTCYRIEARILKYSDTEIADSATSKPALKSLTIPAAPPAPPTVPVISAAPAPPVVSAAPARPTKQVVKVKDERQFLKKTTLAKPVSTPLSTHGQGISWAVVIGISKYNDTRIPQLRYAAHDALAFYDWLVSPGGGAHAPQNVKMLIDETATFTDIRNALFVWLTQALEEDQVTIYYAGHGSSESPDSSKNLFLLPYDARYDNIATTGFPMWDIETALKRFIKAQKIVVVADACHSGGVGESFDIARRTNRGIKINKISMSLQELSTVGDGICVISASDSEQFSQEGAKWGGGHGVFTHFLLKGLNGEADYNHDNIVSLGELIPYLSEQVRRETRNAQSPTVSGKFDPAISIAR